MYTVKIVQNNFMLFNVSPSFRFILAFGGTTEIVIRAIRVSSHTVSSENDDQHSTKRLDVGPSIDHIWYHDNAFVHHDNSTRVNCHRKTQKRFVGDTKINNFFCRTKIDHEKKK